MRVLIGNLVKTGCADYPFADREQAEAFVMSLRLRDRQRRAAHAPLTRPSRRTPSEGTPR